ncbi:gamma-glutamylcyclotransferase family protein [Demequina activiva]|uniref:gamma-glutamylcyclotransferase family protein n=1 Tax=Demequina activiva TaxID=1582364 RepID=UPI0019446A6B|nr:gamma-glutamylcyclotransferase family protein [Demequina activiva]
MTAPLTPPPLDGGLDLPYLVYGTLREGGSNAHLVTRHGGRWTGSLILDGFAMVDAPAGYPYVLPRDGAAVRAEVVMPPADARAQVSLRRDLDLLEGFTLGGAANNYERVPLTFVDPRDGADRWGWLYVAGAGALIDGLPAIESGDWFARP